ncbi:hypothetical protein ACFX1X_007701 [Malus domestica]
MELSVATIGAVLVGITVIIIAGAWRLLNWLWLRPKKLERYLRQQGLTGNSYRFYTGDMKEISTMIKQAYSKPVSLSHDIAPRVIPFDCQLVNTCGKNYFVWMGPTPRVNITDPEDMKTILTKMDDFPKPKANPLIKLLATGIALCEGEKWAKHRRIINPVFHIEKLKRMLPEFYQSCSEMIVEWESLVLKEGSCELDVWPYFENMTADVISRTAFGSSYKEGRKIFQLLKEQAKLAIKVVQSVYVPGARFLPTKINMKMKEIDREIRALLMGIINRREDAIRAGEATKDDLLGQETTSVLLVWTMVLLSQYQNWQDRAREEVLQVFGSNKPEFDGIIHLKVVTMILHEVLRLYPALTVMTRTTNKKTQLSKYSLPAGVEVALSTLLVHHDKQLWGDDAHEFKPERFSEGISKATKNKFMYFPFGGGPRNCIGQNFAMVEAKLALSLILQHFTFELSPSYAHAPSSNLIIQPQFGAHIILHKL